MLSDTGASESERWTESKRTTSRTSSWMPQLRSLKPQSHHLPTRYGSGKGAQSTHPPPQSTQPRTCRLTHIHMRPTPIHAAVPQKNLSAPPRCAVGEALVDSQGTRAQAARQTHTHTRARVYRHFPQTSLSYNAWMNARARMLGDDDGTDLTQICHRICYTATRFRGRQDRWDWSMRTVTCRPAQQAAAPSFSVCSRCVRGRNFKNRQQH